MIHGSEMIGIKTYFNVAAASKENDGTNNLASVWVAIRNVMDVLMSLMSGQSKTAFKRGCVL